jgi:RNA polymerase sporulation-specific sigma factor
MENTDENEIFEKNMKLAYMVANRYSNYIREKEDILQIAFEGLWLAVKKYDENKSKFSTFAVTIMTNNINYYLRSVKKESNTAHLFDNISGKENITYMDVLCDETLYMEEAENRIILRNCLKQIRLNDKEQIIFKYWLEGKRQEDISKLTKTSQPSVSRTIKRIKAKLRRKIRFIE